MGVVIQKIYKTVTDLLRTATDRFTDEKITPIIGLMTVFNPLTLPVSVRSRSVADLLRSVNVFRDIFCRRSVKDVRDATRTSRMGIRTIRTVTEELQMRYGRAMDINYRYDSQSLYGKFKQFDFSVASPQKYGIRIGSHKDITDVMDGHTGGKDDP